MAIEDLRTRLRAKFARRGSTSSTLSQSSVEGDAQAPSPDQSRKMRTRLARSSRAETIRRIKSSVRENNIEAVQAVEAVVGEANRSLIYDGATLTLNQEGSDLQETLGAGAASSTVVNNSSNISINIKNDNQINIRKNNQNRVSSFPSAAWNLVGQSGKNSVESTLLTPPASTRPEEPPRRQSLITKLLEPKSPNTATPTTNDYLSTGNQPSTISGTMGNRKIWVKRPGASPTLVQIKEDSLVDDMRDMILKKYANSLGRTFDAPDILLRIGTREQRQERPLGPEEPICRTLDAYYPGGQKVEEALIIDVSRRTPRPSPQILQRFYDDSRPAEAASDYFPAMPPAPASPHVVTSAPAGVNGQPHHPVLTHSMSVMAAGHVPPLPSPGANNSRRHYRDRPRIGRLQTTSPNLIGSSVPQASALNYANPRSRTHSNSSEQLSAPVPTAPPLPTPPAAQSTSESLQIQRVATPPPRITSPRASRPKKTKKASGEHPKVPTGMPNSTVPPISVLIVEDNNINLKLLEAFMKRLKVRWQTAVNGKIAVDKWKAGGFHLVLMDIQLPVMSGLEATREIRRLERLNQIGVFSSSTSSSPSEKEKKDEPQGDDRLPTDVLFKSSVIIVALTASSLQSDRHEALAAGCNDFLTKPVNFVWLERKVMEWGCMQALIDFDGWRKWKQFSQINEDKDKTKKKSNRSSIGNVAGLLNTRSGEGVAA